MSVFGPLVKQFIKFGIVGVSNTFISLAIFYILVWFGVHYILANGVAFVLSVLNAYYWNRKYVFNKMEGSVPRQLVKIYFSYGFTFLLSSILLFLMVDVIGIPVVVAPLINVCITTPVNFVLNRFWTFR